MLVRHAATLASLLSVAAACASVPARQAPESASEITFVVAAQPQTVREQLVQAFTANGLPVAISQPGVVEYHGVRERGILGYYDVFARAVIVPADCATHVTLFGEETKYDNAFVAQGTSTRIGPSSSGRAADLWQKLQLVARSMAGDSAIVHAHC